MVKSGLQSLHGNKMKSAKTIELNGNVYDAVTGKIVGKSTDARPTGGSNIDGFFRTRTVGSAASTVHKPLGTPQKSAQSTPNLTRTTVNHTKAHTPQATQRTANAIAPTTLKTTVKSETKQARTIAINHAKAHKPQTATTLMRTAVKRPDPSLKRQVNVQTALTHGTTSLIEVKRTVTSLDAERLLRAQSTPTSPMVAHHSKERNTLAAQIAPVPVQPVPTPVKPEGDVPPTAPAPQPTNNPQDIFDHALANASHFLDVREHRARFRKHARSHVLSMTAGTLALLLITLFAVYQNSPGLQLKVAGIEAGVSTHMPNFAAAGFAYNGVKAENGKLTVGFTNQAGNYQLTQRTTSWSNQDMINEVSATDASGHPNYTTVKAGSTTIYRFTNTGATWVENGKWYSISGTTGLSDDQVKAIVRNV
jgi:hypothetical protein